MSKMVQMQEREAITESPIPVLSFLYPYHSQLANSCTVRMKAAGFHKMLVPVNQTKHHQIPEDHNLSIQCHENVKSHQHINEVTVISLSLLSSNITYSSLKKPDLLTYSEQCYLDATLFQIQH